jgi:hypothetical protein
LATGASESACSYTMFWNFSASAANVCPAFCRFRSASICAFTSSNDCTRAGDTPVTLIT